MATIKFYPEKRNDKEGNLITKNVPIYLSCYIHGKRLVYFTGKRIDLNNWNESERKAKRNTTGETEINFRLKNITQIISEAELNAEKFREILTVSSLKRQLDIKLRKIVELTIQDEEAIKKTTPLEALDEWIEDREKSEVYGSVKNHRVFRNHFRAFIEARYTDFSFDEINDEFYEGFKSFLHSLGHSINTEAKHTKQLARFLRFSDKKGYSSNSAWKNFKWVTESAPDIITLDEEEIRKIENLELEKPNLDRVKDCFLFQIYCGMRWSDVSSLQKSDWDGDYISFFIQKNRKDSIRHTVALSSKAKAILKKYADIQGPKALPVLSGQKQNQGIKEIGKLAGINTLVKKKMIYGNTPRYIEAPKYEFLSSHCARKTFISIAISKDILESKIKAQTGHEKNSRAFARYYEVKKEDKKSMVDEIFG